MNVGFLSRIRQRPPQPAASRRWARMPLASVRAALDLVYPASCAGCGGEITREAATEVDYRLCDGCVNQLALFAGPTCRLCHAPVPLATDSLKGCIRCRGRRLWFDETVALGEYAGRLRDLLLKMKHSHGNATSLAVAELMWQRRGDRLHALQPHCVVAVPMHWRRRWAHGTNSAALLAEVFAQRLGVRQRAGLLCRRRNTPPQFSLPPSKRWQNVRQAFSVKRGYPIQGAHVLLVDDILTTGATCSEAARTLKAAGAERVSVVVVARTLVH